MARSAAELSEMLVLELVKDRGGTVRFDRLDTAFGKLLRASLRAEREPHFTLGGHRSLRGFVNALYAVGAIELAGDEGNPELRLTPTGRARVHGQNVDSLKQKLGFA